jgi:succinyl-CoA synthetase beta subunit
MNLLEYTAKQILTGHGIDVPCGLIADNADEAVETAREVHLMSNCNRWVIKAQVHTGGRGKAGGIQIASSLPEVLRISRELLGKQLVTHQTDIHGERVKLLLIEEFVPLNMVYGEMYLSLVLNRKQGCHSLVYSRYGGMDIEEISEKHPSDIHKINFDKNDGISEEKLKTVHTDIGIDILYKNKLINLIQRLCSVYVQSDSLLLEINPLVITARGQILPLDAKISIDDNAIFRQAAIEYLHSAQESDELETEEKLHRLNYVKLNGDVACMVNGAGLAMATMDLITYAGGVPANFLDVGGTANSKRVEKAFRILLGDPAVRLVFVNIFGGIVRCDRVAAGIVSAIQNIGQTDVPVIIRLQGTNVKEALEIIKQSGVNVFVTDNLGVAGEIIKAKLGKLA